MTTRGNPVSPLWRLNIVSVALACVFAAGQAQANGTDPAVVAGQASFSTQGSSLSITNSPGTIINWQGFSIGASETTRFIQQSAASSVLNRVIGPDPSVILGTLTSNGRVFLINPSGILFGHGAHIDVAGLVASTLNLSNQDFLAGRLNFSSDALAGNVENRGSITTPSGGSVYLVGADVTNSGIITSPQGDVILAAGQSVNIFDTSTPGVRVELTASDNAAVNLGQILAQSGQVGIYGAALRNAGIIDADQVVRDASGKIVLRAKQDVTLEVGSRLSANGEQGGEITVQSETGTTLVSGVIEAKGTGDAGKGGTVQLLGNNVGLMAASINSSGMTGGGTVLVGGDYQGKNPSVQNAAATYMSADSTINADAITNGDGGKVVLWSNDSTRAYGSMTARGGSQGGDGGLIETSGHWLDVAGINVSASATNGTNGAWLLDPNNITIQAAGAETNVTASPNFTSTNDNAIVTTATIQTVLNGGTGVVITTGSGGTNAQAGDITVADTLTWTHVNGPTLMLNAAQDVIVDAAITATTGSFVANAGRDVNVNAVTKTTTGNLTFNAGGNVNINAALTVTTGNMVMRADNDGTGPGVGGGTVNITCGINCLTITTGNLSIRFNPANYASTGAEITAYDANLTGAGVLDAKAWVFAEGNNRPYDGTTTATVNSSFKDPSSTLPAGITLGSVTSPNFDTKDVGTNKLITFGSTFTDPVYALFAPFGTAVDTGTTRAAISAKTVTLSASKTYTGTTDLTGAVTLGTGIGGETLTYTGATANDAHVATANKYVNAITLTDNGAALASNYQLPTLNVTNAPVTITAAQLTAVATITAAPKVYDGMLVATGSTVGGSLAGEIGSDSVLLDTSALTLAYNDAHVATAGKTISSTGNVALGALTSVGSGDLSGSSAANLVVSAASDYALAAQPVIASVAGTITTKPLTAVDLVGTVTKIYDGDDTVANLTTGNYSITGFIGGEGATIGVTSGTYDAGKNVQGPNSAVTSAVLAAGDYTGTGATLLSNYDLALVTSVSATGNIGAITAKALTLTPITDSKQYDGLITSTAAVTVAGNVAGDTVTVAEEYASKDVLGAGLSTLGIKAGYTILDGALADMSGNYTITDTATAAGTITAPA